MSHTATILIKNNKNNNRHNSNLLDNQMEEKCPTNIMGLNVDWMHQNVSRDDMLLAWRFSQAFYTKYIYRTNCDQFLSPQDDLHWAWVWCVACQQQPHIERRICSNYLDCINSPSPKWTWAWMSSTTLLSEMRRGCRTLYSRRIYTTLALVSRHDIAAVHTPPVSTVGPATTCKLAFLTLVYDDFFRKCE